jgi:ATP-dependent Clp protease adaptor protein ClpS
MGKKLMTTYVDSQVVEKTTEKYKEPGFYKVIFINDNVTPMEFVIDVLQKIFKHSLDTANNIMLTVHNDGSAVVGIYPYEIAEQKGVETTLLARQSGFPLQVKIERE